MSNKKLTNLYDDGNIPKEDLPHNGSKNAVKNSYQSDNVEPLPESTRPRKDGPGGE